MEFGTAAVPISFPSTRQSVASMSMPASPFPEMTLAAPEVVPPIVAPVTKTTMPKKWLATAAVPPAAVPILFPSTRQSVASMSMPSPAFPEMTLAAPEAVPPIVTFDDPTSMPPLELATARVPLALVPTSFPSTRQKASSVPKMSTPYFPFPEMTLAVARGRPANRRIR